MTDDQVAPGAGAPRRVALPAVLLTGLLLTGWLAGCAKTPEAGGSRFRVYSADLVGAAKVCEAPKPNPVGSEAPMTVANDGGWCAIRVHQDGPKPFDAGLLTTRPGHGDVLIHQVGEETRIDYTPDRGFTGSDAFAVKLIPGDAMVKVAVTVTSAKR